MHARMCGCVYVSVCTQHEIERNNAEGTEGGNLALNLHSVGQERQAQPREIGANHRRKAHLA